MDYSVWDRSGLEKVEDNYDRIRKIIELVDINTPLGEEHLVFEKLVQVFETMSDHGKKTRERKC
jgi:hypothetical protein